MISKPLSKSRAQRNPLNGFILSLSISACTIDSCFQAFVATWHEVLLCKVADGLLSSRTAITPVSFSLLRHLLNSILVVLVSSYLFCSMPPLLLMQLRVHEITNGAQRLPGTVQEFHTMTMNLINQQFLPALEHWEVASNTSFRVLCGWVLLISINSNYSSYFS